MDEGMKECDRCEGKGVLKDESKCPECFGLGFIDPVDQEYLHLMAQGAGEHHPVILLKRSLDSLRTQISSLENRIDRLEEKGYQRNHG